MLALSVAVWAGLALVGIRRIRRADTARIRILTGQLGRSVTVVRSTGKTLRPGRSSIAGEIVGVQRHRLVIDHDGRETIVPIASIREIWSGTDRLGLW